MSELQTASATPGPLAGAPPASRWGRMGWAVVAGLLLLAAAGALLLARNGAGSAPVLDNAAIEVARGVYYLGELAPSAAYVVETGDGLVLFDTGLDSDAYRLRSQLSALGLDVRKIKAIFLTHAHGDHTGGARYLREMTGAKVYAGARDAGVIRAGGPREAIFSIFHMPGVSAPSSPVDIELSGGEVISFGDARVRAIATPGHTPGSICYELERGGLRALFTGDVVSNLVGEVEPFERGRNPLGTYSAYLAPQFGGSAVEYSQSLERLRGLPMPDLVLPGHPRSDPTPQSPRLTAGAWQGILDVGITRMRALAAFHEREGQDFLDGDAKLLLPELAYLGNVAEQAVYAVVSKSGVVLVNAPGGAGLEAFVQERLQALGLEDRKIEAVLVTSFDGKNVGGLREVIEARRVPVVAQEETFAALKAVAPSETVCVPAREFFAQRGWHAQGLTLLGVKGAESAYRLALNGRTVLVTGTIPAFADQEPGDELVAELSRTRGRLMDYFLAIQTLASLDPPDLWLPAVPYHAPNANLYGEQWRDIIDANYEYAMAVLEESRAGR